MPWMINSLSTAKRSKLQCLNAGRIVAGKKAAEPGGKSSCGSRLVGVDIPAPMSHMGTPSDSGSATGLLASVDAALSGQTKELAAEQAGQEQRPLVASTAAAGEDFDFHAHFGFSAPTSEEQQEVQEQGQGQDADQTAQDVPMTQQMNGSVRFK